MGEREPKKEIVGKGELFYLMHPGTQDTFSGFGLTLQEGNPRHLVGLLMVDRPHPADPAWLAEVEAAFGEYQLAAMTAAGERGIVCQMQIEPDSLPYLQRFPGEQSAAIKLALEPLLEQPPNPVFAVRWHEETRSWESKIIYPQAVLPPEIREVFENVGYGCLPVEMNIGVVHVCHIPTADIEGFAGKPVLCQWQLIEMPTAPLIRLEMVIFDNPLNPYRVESFLNVGEEDQLKALTRLANQDKVYLAFYGDNLKYQFTQTIEHGKEQWQQLDEIIVWALTLWNKLPAHQRDFDRAKREFMALENFEYYRHVWRTVMQMLTPKSSNGSNGSSS
ncbi:MAG: hypothetical protein MN733_10600 [Nitrososphaera sp.]|nr:hypothetical protein [Nitrososphaera sp.]